MTPAHHLLAQPLQAALAWHTACRFWEASTGPPLVAWLTHGDFQSFGILTMCLRQRKYKAKCLGWLSSRSFVGASWGLRTGGGTGRSVRCWKAPDTPAGLQLNAVRQQGTRCLSCSHVPDVCFCGGLRLSLSSEQQRQAVGQTHPGRLSACTYLRCYLG